MANVALEEGWDIVAVLNNDMIGNVEGIVGTIDNTTFRVFSEAVPATDDLQAHRMRRFFGGEVYGPSRHIVRYVDRISHLYFPNLRDVIISRLGRIWRRAPYHPFND